MRGDKIDFEVGKGREGSPALMAGVMAVLTLLLASAPYVIAARADGGRHWIGLGYNSDDACVYLSWMRQAADGAWRGQNYFTTMHQNGVVLNPFFLVLGKAAGALGVPLIAMFHTARVLCGALMLFIVWRLIAEVTAHPLARRLAFGFVCLGAGLGWLPYYFWSCVPISQPIDVWQPEAITFLSLTLSPLFCFSLALQAAIFLFLLRGERTKNTIWSIAAGLCGLALGLTHTYDVISVTAVAVTWLVVAPLVERSRFERGTLIRAAITALVAAPGTAFILLDYLRDPVFQARANKATLSPRIDWVLIGYGGLAVLAAGGIAALAAERRSAASGGRRDAPLAVDGKAAALLVVWALVNVAVSYAPVAFQRKMIQGSHFPIAILAGFGGAVICTRLRRAVKFSDDVALVALVLPASFTNLCFLNREIENYAANRSQNGMRAYLNRGEIDALDWIRANSSPDDAFQPLPWLRQLPSGVALRDWSIGDFGPGYIGRHVFAGHWGETPSFGTAIGYCKSVELRRTSESRRLALIQSMHVRYLFCSQRDGFAPGQVGWIRHVGPAPPYLRLRYTNEDADVYEVTAGYQPM